MAAIENAAPDMVDPAIFERLQQNIDDDAHVREELRDILQKLERQGMSLLYAITIILFCVWLGGGGKPQGSLPTIEEVGSTLKVPTNVKDRDTFHITTEEYLHALISLIEELARLAVNSVTLGDYQRPLQISKFVKDIHAGFQILNLKNDSLRRRSDSIKYSVKKIEDVVYDLSLRNLVPSPQESRME
ncbi:MAG: hypothetical protein LQ346_002727 [Caloplaca aetnensis]|nr:MAG: hypothetical protein LQ346_002727 [Caloplaca aetnensis]